MAKQVAQVIGTGARALRVVAAAVEPGKTRSALRIVSELGALVADLVEGTDDLEDVVAQLRGMRKHKARAVDERIDVELGRSETK